MRAFSQSLLGKLPAIATGALLVVEAVWLLKFRSRALPLTWIPEDSYLLVTATCSTVLVMIQRLPLQSVIAASLSILLFALGVEWLLNVAFVVASSELPVWAYSVLWVVGLLAARAYAQVALGPWRSHPVFGIALIITTGLLCGVLVSVFSGAFEPAQRAGWFLWQSFWRFIAATLIAALCVPWFIRKSPAPLPKGFFASVNWLASNMLLLLVAVSRNRWEWAVCLLLVNAGVAAVSWFGRFRTAE